MIKLNTLTLFQLEQYIDQLLSASSQYGTPLLTEELLDAMAEVIIRKNQHSLNNDI